MASWLSLALFAAAVVVAVSEARAIPAEPVSLMMDSYGNPVLFLREKRAPASPYPHRAMMFTGYYRPVRRTNAEEGQASGVFAQGNAVSGGAYLGEAEPNYLQRGPEPNEEPADVSSAEAEAAPNPLEHHVDEEEQSEPAQQEEQHDQQDTKIAQEEEQAQEQEQEAPVAAEPAAPSAPRPVRPARKQQGPKKTKKTPVQFEAEDEDESEDIEDDDDSDDEPASPFVPFKANGRRPGPMPNLQNFFPMVFSFPRGNAGRGGSASGGSPPGMITAIANSYSTAKGGVASSVATAYGGSPQPKKSRRAQPAQE